MQSLLQKCLKGKRYGEVTSEEDVGDLPSFAQPSEHPLGASFGNILRVCLDDDPLQGTIGGQTLLDDVNHSLQGDYSSGQIPALQGQEGTRRRQQGRLSVVERVARTDKDRVARAWTGVAEHLVAIGSCSASQSQHVCCTRQQTKRS